MLAVQPRAEKLKLGMKFVMGIPGSGHIELTVRNDGKVVGRVGGDRAVFDAEDFTDGDICADMDSWMILAHLAGHPFMAQTMEGTDAGRADPMLLTEVGTAPMSLRRPVQHEDMNGVLMHHIEGHGSIVCHKAGIVEAITLSIYMFFRRDGARVEDWLDEAIERGSFALLARIDIALSTMTDSGDPDAAAWAKRMLASKVRPALKNFPTLH